MTMAASIEGRVPYLDHRIVELGMSLPVSMKIDSKGDKQILREALRGIVPESMRTRKKQRFNTPIHEFLAEDIDKIARKLFSEKNQLNEEIFHKKTLLQLLDYKKTASYRLLLRHNKLSAQYYARQLWSIIVFYLWYKMYFEDILPENLLEQ
jgi:asparagine synthase (glutamine-hydrolysing)